jgi:uncharacterized protein YfcZ (UPF0381/DUF406 family)
MKTKAELLAERNRIDKELRDLEVSCHSHDEFLASMCVELEKVDISLSITMPMNIDLEFIAGYSMVDGSFNLDFDTCFDVDELHSEFTSEYDIFCFNDDELTEDILKSFRNHLKCVKSNGEKVAKKIEEYADKNGLDRDSLKQRFEDRYQ